MEPGNTALVFEFFLIPKAKRKKQLLGVNELALASLNLEGETETSTLPLHGEHEGIELILNHTIHIKKK